MNKIVQQLTSMLATSAKEITKAESISRVAVVQQDTRSLVLEAPNKQQLSFVGRDLPTLPKVEMLSLKLTAENGAARLQLPNALPLTQAVAATEKWVTDALTRLLLNGQTLNTKLATDTSGRAVLTSPIGLLKATSVAPLPQGTPVAIQGLTEITAKIAHTTLTTNQANIIATVEKQQNGQLFLNHKTGTLVLKTALKLPAGESVNVALDLKNQQATLQSGEGKLLAVNLSAKTDELILMPLINVPPSTPNRAQASAQESALQQLLRQLMPKQRPLAENFSRLLEPVLRPGPQVTPSPVKAYFQEIAGQLPSPQQLSQLKPLQIRSLLLFSALMRTGQSRQQPVANMQVHLLQAATTLLQTEKAIGAWQRVLPVPFKMLTRALQVPLADARPHIWQANPFSGPGSKQKNVNAVSRQFQTLALDWMRQSGDLLKTVESAVARQQVVNLQLAKTDASPNQMNFEIPLHLGNRVDGVEVAIKKKKATKKKRQQTYSLSLNFDLQRLGRVKVLVDLKDSKTINTRFFSEHDSTVQTFADHFTDLKTQLGRCGVVLDQCQSQRSEKLDDENHRKDWGFVNVKA